MAWRLARSLTKLRWQINEVAPGRSKISDGSIGDARHRNLVSDHNPDKKGRVCAIDITHDPKGGVDGAVLSEQLTADPRVKYVIYNGWIWKARTGKWEDYTGANQHKSHVHVSVTPEGADSELKWALGEVAAPKYGDTLEFVKAFQRQHGLQVDGIPGPKTYRALKESN